ncbi:MAG: PHP domain-containing protein [Desulfotignum sp.]|nr:PHP domain-containing protein [Desulfotignum sp.]
MPIQNTDIAAQLKRMSDLLEIEGGNPFRVRAYRNAARIINSLARPVADLIRQKEDLTEFPGIGQDLASLEEMVQTAQDMGYKYLAITDHSVQVRIAKGMDTHGLEKVMAAAKENGCFLELNAQPDRLDLNDEACRLARYMGVKIAVSSDAHNTGNLSYLRLGIDQARRGWLESSDVINTSDRGDLIKMMTRI